MKSKFTHYTPSNHYHHHRHRQCYVEIFVLKWWKFVFIEQIKFNTHYFSWSMNTSSSQFTARWKQVKILPFLKFWQKTSKHEIDRVHARSNKHNFIQKTESGSVEKHKKCYKLKNILKTIYASLMSRTSIPQ